MTDCRGTTPAPVSNLLSLAHDTRGDLHICPRWPARRVHVDELALRKLAAAQATLPQGITLILTRGYEPKAARIGMARRQFRAVGTRVFRMCYPARTGEIADIFGSNGHDIDGTHIDVSFRVNGHRVRMLPLGVFTPPALQKRRAKRYAAALAAVNSALLEQGFRLHRNPTERLQIHCDLIR